MDEIDNLKFIEKPPLRNPYLICGLNGWLNSGDVAVGGIKYLIEHFNATPFAEIQTSRYHVYQIPGVHSARPVFKMEDGVIKETDFPKNQFYYAGNPSSDHDIILLLGTEPNLYWEEYGDTVVTLSRELGVTRIYTFGAIYDRSPYNREPHITCTCTGGKIRDEMVKYNVTMSSREGMATINLMLLYAFQKSGLDGVNLTVRVPYYPEFNVGLDYSPRSVKAVLERLNHLMKMGIDFSNLNKEISEIEDKLDDIRKKNAEFNTYLEELEKNYTETPYQEPFDISPDEALRFAEELLKDNRDRKQNE
ncbi:MAG: PAC2 family protein [Dehalococcoidales bacterium]|nr:MAG: PAC2 family protein [Dehalococcoidales bacterium]